MVVNYVVSGTATSGSDYASSYLPGSVTISAGSSTATVNVTPTNDSTLDGSETITIELGSSTAFHPGPLNRATITIADDDAPGDPGWTGVNNNNSVLGNSYRLEPHDQGSNGVRGEIGGTITHSQVDSYYADINLADLNGSNFGKIDGSIGFSASGKLDVHDISADYMNFDVNGGFFVGHFLSGSVASTRAGIDFERWGTDTVQVRARFGGARSPEVFLSVDGNHTFQYIYDPNPALGPNGKLHGSDRRGHAQCVGSDRYLSRGWYHARCIRSGHPSGLNTDTGSARTAQVFIDDVSYSGQQSTATPTVSIDATTAGAVEGGASGAFVVTRTVAGPALTVFYGTNSGQSGAATTSSDYNLVVGAATLSGSVTIPSGSTSVTIAVNTVNDSTAELSEPVTLTISPNSGYFVDSQAGSDTVTIADDEPIVTIEATDPDATEGSDNGVFKLTRTTTSGTLAVNVAVTGAAVYGAGSDYTATPGLTISSGTASITFSAGSSTAFVTIVPVNDAAFEGDEAVTLTLNPLSTYTKGSPGNATVTIHDSEAVVRVVASTPTGNETGPSNGVFTISRVAAGPALVVNYVTAGGTPGTDYYGDHPIRDDPQRFHVRQCKRRRSG